MAKNNVVLSYGQYMERRYYYFESTAEYSCICPLWVVVSNCKSLNNNGERTALGKGPGTKSDEFRKKAKGGGAFLIQKFMLQIWGTLNRFFIIKLIQNSNFRVQGMRFQQLY